MAGSATDVDPYLQVFGREGQEALDAGMRATPSEAMPAFLRGFRAKNLLQSPGAEPALALLELGGGPRRDTHQGIIEALRDDLLGRIKEAARRDDQLALLDLFNLTQEYITVPDLAPVVIAIMEAGGDSVVDADYWHLLNSSDQTEGREYQQIYPCLSPVLKARMWVLHPEAFDSEVFAVLRNLSDFAPPQTVPDLFRPEYYNENGRSEETVNKLTQLVKFARKMDPVARIAGLFVSRCELPTAPENSRVAVANLLLDFLTQPMFDSRGGDNRYLQPLYKDMVYAARVIIDRSFEECGVRMENQEIATLATWARGCTEGIAGEEVQPERVRIMALLLHSSHARGVLANRLATRLADFRAAPHDDVVSRLKDDPFLPNLTLLTLSSIEAKSIIDLGKPLAQSAVDAPFETFYPVLVAEMRRDRMWMKHLGSAYMELPDPRLLAATRNGLLEKRVVCSYGYMLAQPIPEYEGRISCTRLSRLLLVFDAIFDRSSITNIDGEEREQVLSGELIALGREDIE